MSVKLTEKYANHVKNYSINDRTKILEVVNHVKETGTFQGLPGRNKNSNEVDKNDRNWKAKVDFANKHNLWHYHIGIPKYDETKIFGDYTSEYMLHYQIKDGTIWIVDMSPHPFSFPLNNYLVKDPNEDE